VGISREVCPFHADDDVRGIPTGSGDGSLTFICDRAKGHPHGGPHSWLRVPDPPDVAGIDGFAAELGLATKLPAALVEYRGRWVEYGLVERSYALRCPDDFRAIVARFGHNELAQTPYTASAFLARTLGALGRTGAVLYHDGPATGRWSYNSRISWWSLSPMPDWDTSRLSWLESGLDISYLPSTVQPEPASPARSGR
jgi:hypothetical protein